MLVLFAFSITPKKILHDLVATHTDSQSINFYGYGSPKARIHQAVIHCNCEQLIVESVFLPTVAKYEISALSVRNFFHQTQYSFVFKTISGYSGLRGPPAV